MGLLGAVVLLAVGFFSGLLGEIAFGKPVASLLAKRHQFSNLDFLSVDGASQLLKFLAIAGLGGVVLGFFAWRLPQPWFLLIISGVSGAAVNAVFGWPATPLIKSGW